MPSVWTHLACSGSLLWLLPTTPVCSHPRWLRPRRHAAQPPLSQGPHVIGQPRRQRGCPRLPACGGAGAGRRFGVGQRPAYRGRRSTAVIGGVGERQLRPPPVFALAERAAPAPDRRARLAAAAVEPLHAGGVAVPARRRQHGIDGLSRATHPALTAPDQTPSAHGLAPVRLEPLGQRPPARRGRRALGLAAGRLPPGPRVGQQRRQGLPPPIGAKLRGTVGGQDLGDVVDHALGQRQGTLADGERQQPRARGVQRSPPPRGRTLQARAGLGRADLPVLDRPEESTHLSALDLADAPIVEKGACQRLQGRGCRHQPLQDGMGGDRAPPCGAPEAHAFRQARENPHAKVDRDAWAMAQGAMGLQTVAITAGAGPVTPGAPTGMAVGAERAAPSPAARRTAGLRTAGHGGVDLTGAALGPDDRGGWPRRGPLGRRRLVLTEGTGWLMGEACQRLGRSRALAVWQERRGWSVCSSRASARPSRGQQEKPPQQSQQPQLREKQVWHPGQTSSFGGETGGFYLIRGPIELSAAWRYTTLWRGNRDRYGRLC
jgi:hypothetical protein